MSSFATLASTTAYLTLLTQINDRDIDLSKGLDPAYTTVTSPPTNAVRYNSANKRWEMYNGTSWVELIASATDAFNMTVTGVRGGNFYGTITNNGTISGGTVNATTLQAAGSAAWTAATLTNLNQLTNGPGFIGASALSAYALLASPTFTGVPAAPTAAVNTNTTQLATTAYVMNQSYLTAAAAAASYAALASPALTGVPTAPTATAGTNTTQIATTAYVIGQGYAPLGGAGASGTWGISISGVAASASAVAWANVTGHPTAVSAFTNDSGYITSAGTSAACSGNAATASAVAWSGVTSKPINSVTTTTATTTPTGGVAGDLVLGY